jgi:hypothetical protein
MPADLETGSRGVIAQAGIGNTGPERFGHVSPAEAGTANLRPESVCTDLCRVAWSIDRQAGPHVCRDSEFEGKLDPSRWPAKRKCSRQL